PEIKCFRTLERKTCLKYVQSVLLADKAVINLSVRQKLPAVSKVLASAQHQVLSSSRLRRVKFC
ncbi:MAG: hypothetical protein KDJ99_16705, partial [Candidatus Competibacteraceae bacterium]|nr:hypothetical protein [Candidatus Competibacteraceae bacterium]